MHPLRARQLGVERQVLGVGGAEAMTVDDVVLSHPAVAEYRGRVYLNDKGKDDVVITERGFKFLTTARRALFTTLRQTRSAGGGATAPTSIRGSGSTSTSAARSSST